MDIRDIKFETYSTGFYSPKWLRATHIPTGKSVSIKVTGSLLKAKEKALFDLRSKG